LFLDAKAEEKAPKVDLIQNITGAFGKYQLLLCLLIFLSKFPVAFHQMAIIFLAPKTPYTCKDSDSACPCDQPVYDTSVFTATIISEWNLICQDKWLTSFTQTLFQLGTLIGSILFGMASDRYILRNLIYLYHK
jgi:MFS family permease